MTWTHISRDLKGTLKTRDGDANCYGTNLGSILSGKALKVYSRLPASEARDYYKLK